MVKRAHYRIPQDNWPPPIDRETKEPAEVPNAVVLAVTTRYAYLHSAVYPNPYIERVLKGDFLGNTYTELHGQLSATTRKAIFCAEVDRKQADDEGGRVVARQLVPMNKVRTGDTVVRDFCVPHAFGAQESVEEQRRLDALLET